MKRLLPLAAVALCAVLAGCSAAGGTSPGPSSTELDHPGDVSKGGRVVYVLQDASCDMNGRRELQNRQLAVKIAANAAAFDSGTVARGVVRQLSSQNVIFNSVNFKRDGSSSILRVDNALNQLDDAYKKLRPLGGSAGGQACQSDLLSALSQVAHEERVVAQRDGRDPPQKDIVFVTNGLIVDPTRKVVLTRQAIEKPAVFRSVLKTIRDSWIPPDLHGFTVWFVGLGHNEQIKTERGPAVIQLWEMLLKPTGAIVKEPVETANELPPTLGSPTN